MTGWNLAGAALGLLAGIFVVVAADEAKACGGGCRNAGTYDVVDVRPAMLADGSVAKPLPGNWPLKSKDIEISCREYEIGCADYRRVVKRSSYDDIALMDGPACEDAKVSIVHGNEVVNLADPALADLYVTVVDSRQRSYTPPAEGEIDPWGQQGTIVTCSNRPPVKYLESNWVIVVPSPDGTAYAMLQYRLDRLHGRKLQKFLTLKGYDPGPIDGHMGPMSWAAFASFMKGKFEFSDQITMPTQNLMSQERVESYEGVRGP